MEESWKTCWYLFNLILKFFILVFLAPISCFCKWKHAISYETARHPL